MLVQVCHFLYIYIYIYMCVCVCVCVCNIITGPKQFKPWKVPTAVGCIVVVGALILHVWFESYTDEYWTGPLCCRSNQKPLLYKRWRHIDHSTITRLFKKFHLNCKNLDDQVSLKLGSEAMLQPIEANLVTSTQKVSGKLSISQFSVVHYLHKLGKRIWSCWIVPHVTKILILSPLYLTWANKFKTNQFSWSDLFYFVDIF